MFYTTLYFFFCYGTILCFIFGVLVFLGLSNATPLIKKIGIWLCLLTLPTPFIPYIVVATQTAIYKKQMMAEVRKALKSMGEPGDDILTFRILGINASRAKVYIVQPCGEPKERERRRSATTFDFKHMGNEWQFEEYSSPWSECGSAEGNTFPPYTDAREF